MPAEQTQVDGHLPAVGEPYSARCKTSYLDFDGKSHTTAYGPVISFVYRANVGPQVGDVNGDGAINISDVNALIDLILRSAYSSAGDVNGDGSVNITDINVLINMIIAG